MQNRRPTSDPPISHRVIQLDRSGEKKLRSNWQNFLQILHPAEGLCASHIPETLNSTLISFVLCRRIVDIGDHLPGAIRSFFPDCHVSPSFGCGLDLLVAGGEFIGPLFPREIA